MTTSTSATRRFAPSRALNVSRAALLFGTALGVSIAVNLTTPEQALAANECGAPAAGVVHCTPAGNPYPVGIEYVPVADLTVILDAGVVVNSADDGVDIASVTPGVSGTITTTAGDTITAADIGAYVIVNGDNATINNAATVSAGHLGLAIDITGAGNASVTNTGAITVNGPVVGVPAAGIIVYAEQGSTTISNTAAINVTNTLLVGGNAGGIIVQNDFPDLVNDTGVSITSTGAINVTASNYAYGVEVIADGPTSINVGNVTATGQYAWGVYVLQTDPNLVSVSFGNIVANSVGGPLGGGAGVSVYNAATGPVTITGTSIATTGAYSDGVRVGGHLDPGIAGNTTVNVGTISTTGAGSDGVDISGPGSFGVTVGTVTTTGAGSRGLELTSTGGNITATIGSAGTGGITTTGGGLLGDYANIVRATTTGTGTISITNAGVSTTSANNTDGILTTAVNGATTITNSGTLRTGVGGNGDNADAVFATATGTGAITVTNTGTMSTNDINANAIYTIANSGLTTVNTSGSITTTGANSYGVYSVGTAGGVTVNATGGTIATSGAASDAIRAVSATGPVSVAQTGGAITTTGVNADGIVATSGTGAVSVTGAGSISTTGATANGVVVTTTGAATVNRTGSITTTGANSDGILATGSTATVTTGAISVSGVGSDGVRATALTGAAAVTVNGAVNATQGYGAVIVGATTASLTVNSGASLTGGTGFDAVDITSATGTTITNNGTISRVGTGFAIDANGAGAATINNNAAGVINGAIDLTGGNDTVNNTGTYNLTSGTIDFGLGTDTFNNNLGGTVRMNGGVATTVTISNLETFNNAGLVDLRNGHTGDILAMPGTVFAASGTGSSRLGVDANLTTATADQLQIGDATGVTSILVTNLGGQGAIGTQVTVVDASGDMDGSEFVLDGGSIDQGFVRFDLVFDAATDQFRLQGAPDTEVFQQIRTMSAVQDFANRSTDTWFARTQEIRDAQGAASPTRSGGWEMWAQAHGGSDSFGSTRSFTFGTPAVTTTENLGTDSSWRGFQMGADNLSGNMLWGVTGGFAQQDTNFESGPNGLDIEGWNVGAYLGWNSGGLFVNGLVKADWFTVDMNVASAGFISHMDGHSWGAAGELGYRFGGPGFFVEPIAKIAWNSSNVDGFSAPTVDFDFDDATGLKGEAGARIGGQWGSIQPFAGLYAVKDFDGENQVTVTSGGTTLVFSDEQRSTYGKADFGFNILGWGGLEGFVKGETLFGGDASGFTGRLGVRWRW